MTQLDGLPIDTSYVEVLQRPIEFTTDAIAQNINQLHALNNYTFNAIQLSNDMGVDEVSEIFVRVNSKGTSLTQADFILTLMSVYWNEGRKALEEFSRQAKTPSKGMPSPFNWFIEPSPDQLLRVSIGLGHRRAQLKYAYELLRGKNLETGEISDENRTESFDLLRLAQNNVLDITNWQEYLKALQEAGYRSGKMVTSKNSIVFSYLIYLIGRCDFGLDHKTLRSTVARWFFMVMLTSRYTGSPESQVEKDIRRFAEAKSGEEFIAIIDSIVSSNLTNDYWEVTLPEQLAWSGGYVPAMFAYVASQNLLGAKVLFSKLTVHQLLDPANMAKKKSLERHHLFPKGYLAKLGVTGTPRVNQVANYALLEWPDNIAITDNAPAEYFPSMFEKYVADSDKEFARFVHALPEGWELMDYDKFLIERRRLIAKVIRAGYEKLATGGDFAVHVEELPPSLDELLEAGEGESVEYKSSLMVPLNPDIPEKVIVGACVKTIAAFLNTEGGTLVIGVGDDGAVLGIEADLERKRMNLDQFQNALASLIIDKVDANAIHRCRFRFVAKDNRTVCLVDVKASAKPVYAETDKGKGLFYVRAANTTRQLDHKETVEYVRDRWGLE